MPFFCPGSLNVDDCALALRAPELVLIDDAVLGVLKNGGGARMGLGGRSVSFDREGYGSCQKYKKNENGTMGATTSYH